MLPTSTPPLLILRVHTDLRLGLGHVARALILQAQWRALGGTACLAVSGDARARRMGDGLHPTLDQPLPCEAVDLGEDLHAGLPPEVQARGAIVLVDHWEAQVSELQALRPLKLALMEDETEAHEGADLLFQPFLEGVSWPGSPLRVVAGRKLRPLETVRGGCRVLRGSQFIVVDPLALRLRPLREPLQPLAAHKLLVTFGGTDGPGLARRALAVLRDLVATGRWTGSCTLLAPQGLTEPPFPGCRILPGLPGLTARLPEFDALWCAGGVTLAEANCLGLPAATWAQNDRQHLMLAELAQHNGCLDLGVGAEADPATTAAALAQWLGPEGQETRQEQVRDGRALVDGQGGQRVIQALRELAQV